MLWLWALSAFYPALAAALYVGSDDQLPLSSNPTASRPVLRRFPLSHITGGRNNIDEVLKAAELSGAHVWSIGTSHVDLVFNDASQRLSPETFSSDVGTIPFDRLHDLAPNSRWDVGPRALANSTYHELYHPLSEITDFVGDIAAAHPALVELVDLGHSGNGREMLAMKISSSPTVELGAGGSAKKLGFVITGAQHAREWIATSTALYLAHALVSDPAEEWSLYRWLEYFDFYIVPVPNPDGYVFTWEYDRFWYKNRQNLGAAETCTGIDMNRNWGYKWNARSRLPSFANSTDEFAWFRPGKSTDEDPCSTWYPGHRPFEAPEVNNIANFVTTLPNLKAFIDLRSYGQMLSTPYSFSCKRTPKDAENQVEAALGAVKAIAQVHGTAFTTGSLCEQLYKASGNVVDYMYARAGIKFAYSVHLRDTGTYGFSLPAEWIRPVGEETANMIRFLAGFISKQKL